MMRSDIAELNDPGIVVKKGERRLELYDGDEFIKAFTIVLGSAPDGDKNVEGDGRTPVGDFYIFTKNPESKFHLSLGISYPDGRAAERGLGSGLIDEAEYDAIRQAIAERSMPPQRSRLGGEIYIHGGGTKCDWTDGCIALADQDIEELFNAVRVGSPVTITA